MPHLPTTRIKSAEAQFGKRIHEFWAADIAEYISTVRNHLLNCKLSGEIALSSLSSMHDVLMLIQFIKSRQCQRTWEISKCLQIEADLSFSMAVGGRILKNASGFSWHFVHTKKEDLSCLLSDNIDSREAFAQTLMLSLDEDPDTSNILGHS